VRDRVHHRERCRRPSGRRLKQIGKPIARGLVELFDVSPSAGKADHAEFQAAPGPACTTVPKELAARAPSSHHDHRLALHGLRLAEGGPRSKPRLLGQVSSSITPRDYAIYSPGSTLSNNVRQ
jgi:hypothetical protein